MAAAALELMDRARRSLLALRAGGDGESVSGAQAVGSLSRSAALTS
jgi:hypothetical protein